MSVYTLLETQETHIKIPNGTTHAFINRNYELVDIELPSTLEYLDVSYNNLCKLPSLPDSLQVLLCSDNHLEELPELPKNLEILSCRWNKITRLPTLPNKLKSLICENELFIDHLDRVDIICVNEDLKSFLMVKMLNKMGKGYDDILKLYRIFEYGVDSEKYKKAEEEFNKL